MQAWYELETCASHEKTERLGRFHELLDASIAKADIKGVSRNELKRVAGRFVSRV